MNKNKTEWVKCPICGDPDMEQTTSNDGDVLIHCVNYACRSNGGTYQIEPKAVVKAPERERPFYDLESMEVFGGRKVIAIVKRGRRLEVEKLVNRANSSAVLQGDKGWLITTLEMLLKAHDRPGAVTFNDWEMAEEVLRIVKNEQL